MPVNIATLIPQDESRKTKKCCPFLPPVQVAQPAVVHNAPPFVEIMPIPCLKEGCMLYDVESASCRAASAPIARLGLAS